MELNIILENINSREAITHLKRHIDNYGIIGIDTVTIDRTIRKESEMGDGNILNSITAMVSAANEPLVELVKCLQMYINNYRTMITIPTKNGNIVLEHGKSMSPEQLQHIVTAIQQNDK